MQRLKVAPGGALRGRIRVPGDKSISHRAVMLGAIADGETRASGFLNGEDCLATLNIFRQLGVAADHRDDQIQITGAGLHGLLAPTSDLDCGNSGTSMRLLSGLLSGQAFDSVLTGDASLSRRPMRRVTEPLREMGASIESSASGTAPLHIYGQQVLRGIDYTSPVASAQIKSALLLGGLYADGDTVIHEPGPSRDHSERMLQTFGQPVSVEEGTVRMTPAGGLAGCEVQIPGDISSAAFFIVGASIAPGSDLVIENIGLNPTRTGVLDIMRDMGANIEVLEQRLAGAEPIGDLRVRHADLQGIHIRGDVVARAIDEFPAVFIAAACAKGETVLTDAAELRVKESDRIAVMAEGLTALGIDAEALEDGIRIQGGALQSGGVEGHGDHRISMAFAMAGLRAAGDIHINDCAAINTSFPGFTELAASSGLQVAAS